MQRPFLLPALVALLSAACAAQPTPAPLIEPYAVPAMPATPAEAAPEEALTAHPWKWVSFINPVEKFDVESPESYLLTFHPDGTVDIQADCNRAGGSYTVDGSRLTIAPGPMTLAQCPPGSRGNDFIRYLGGAAIYFFRESSLYLDLMADGGTMKFAPLE
jgi:heat shock protein HslJ